MTPLERQKKLAVAIGIPDLFFKREDLHAYGSHKGRSIPFMLDHYYGPPGGGGDRNFVISSSGNAALAAALHVKAMNGVFLDIFIGQHAAPHKVEKLKALVDENIRILIKERPLQAVTLAAQEGARSLRQSTDDIALLGYESLAKELAEANEVNKIGAVFAGTSSGTTAEALAQYFVKNKLPIQVHIVQTSSCHHIADGFENYDGPDEKSIADAIVDQTAQRKDALVPLIKKTGGRAWVATNDDIESALELIQKNTDTKISANGVLGVVGAMKAAYVGHEIDGAVVCVIGGE